MSSDIDLSLDFELLHAGVRRVALSDPGGILDHVRVTVGIGPTVRDVITALAQLYTADRAATGALLDALAAADSEVSHVEGCEGSWDPVFHECSWAVAWDRADADREDAVTTLLTRVFEHTQVSADTHQLQLTTHAARQFAAALLLTVADMP